MTEFKMRDYVYDRQALNTKRLMNRIVFLSVVLNVAQFQVYILLFW